MDAEVRNFTPFVPTVYEHVAVSGAHFHPFVLKGTFEVNGNRLLLSQSPASLNQADEYYGEVNSSSVRLESDYIPFKPHTDVYFIDPVAYALKQTPQATWEVSVSVGSITKSLKVFGPRKWLKGFWGWKLGEPEECLQVPIRYELAFGGADAEQVFTKNPVGRGFVTPSKDDDFPAHQLEGTDDSKYEIGSDHTPAGLGPIARSWQPRLDLAGTFDDHWLENKWPVMPDDFDFKHFNCASSGLILDDYLLGGERVTCTGLTANGCTQFDLPNYTVFILIRCHDGTMIPWRCNLDTVAINLEENVCFLTWRAQLPKLPYRVLEARVFEND